MAGNNLNTFILSVRSSGQWSGNKRTVCGIPAQSTNKNLSAYNTYNASLVSQILSTERKE